MSDLPKALAAKRWRCFGRLEANHQNCGQPATWRGKNPLINDRICYFCDDCRPGEAEPLTESDMFFLVGLAFVVKVPAVTLDPAWARTEATARMLSALEALGCRVEFGRAWGEVRHAKAGIVGVTGSQPGPTPIQTA